jgi:hypothetical protein
MSAYQDMLGQHYQQVLAAFPELQRVAIDESLTASEQDYYLASAGGTIECNLDEQGCVSSLFVKFNLGAPPVLDIHQQTSLASLIQRFGAPVAKGRGRRSEVFGNLGGWVKFQAGPWFLHLEFEATQPLFKMMTVMTKNIG